MSEDKEDTAEELLNRAQEVARHAYCQHVKECAEDLVDRIDRGDINDCEGFHTALHEDVDGDGWVIYTSKAKLVCMVSDHSEYGVESGTVDDSCFKNGIPWDKLAYCALEQDIIEWLLLHEDETGVDINQDDLRHEDTWDEWESDDQTDVEDQANRDHGLGQDPGRRDDLAVAAVLLAIKERPQRYREDEDIRERLLEAYCDRWDELEAAK